MKNLQLELTEKIKESIRNERIKTSASGTEPVKILLQITEEEREVLKNITKFNSNHYWWRFEEPNMLRLFYFETIPEEEIQNPWKCQTCGSVTVERPLRNQNYPYFEVYNENGQKLQVIRPKDALDAEYLTMDFDEGYCPICEQYWKEEE